VQNETDHFERLLSVACVRQLPGMKAQHHHKSRSPLPQAQAMKYLDT